MVNTLPHAEIKDLINDHNFLVSEEELLAFQHQVSKRPNTLVVWSNAGKLGKVFTEEQHVVTISIL